MAVVGSIQIMYLTHPKLKHHILREFGECGRVLGKGAFGRVVELQMGGTRYAGKQIHESLLDVDCVGVSNVVQKFVEECEIMSAVKHPNIVQFMGICLIRDSDHPLLVMEYLDMSLDYLIQARQGNLPLSLKYRMLLDVVRGLLYLHTRNPAIIHRDITARNILLNRVSLKAKIADLGNALMIDSRKLINTLSKMPGTALYMPPEAALIKPKYDASLDMFSFGHLALYVVTEVFPDELLPATYMDPKTEKIKGYTEVERRTQYMEILHKMKNLSKDHGLSKMIRDCLHNIPERRPTAQDVLNLFEDIIGDVEDPYTVMQDACKLDLIQLATNGSEKIARASNVYDLSTTTQRVKDLKDGQPGLVEICQKRGRLKPYVLKIQDGCLRYHRSGKENKIVDEIDLKDVVSIDALKSSDPGKYGFTITSTSTSGQRSKQWTLSTYTQEERLSWMGAIRAVGHCVGNPMNGDTNEEHRLSRNEEDEDVYVDMETKPVAIEPLVYDELPRLSETGPTHSLNPGEAIVYDSLSDLQAHSSLPQSTSLSCVPGQPDPFELYDDVLNIPRPPAPTALSGGTSSAQSALPSGIQKTRAQSQHIGPTASSIGSFSVPPSSPLSDPSRQLLATRDGAHLSPSLSRAESQRFPVTDDEPVYTGSQVETIIHKAIEVYESTKLKKRDTKISQENHQMKSVTEHQLSLSHSGDKMNHAKQIGSAHEPEDDDAMYTQIEDKISYSRVQTTKPQAPPVPKPRKKLSEGSAVAQLAPYTSSSILAESGPRSLKMLIGDEDIYTPRPEWAKAATTESISTAEEQLHILRSQALFIPRSKISFIKKIGTGQYGQIHKAVYAKGPNTKLIVAVKTIKKYESQKAYNDFLNEMGIMAKLIHPNVIKLHGLVNEGSSPMIVLEFMENGDLGNFLKTNPRPIDTLVKYMYDVAMGMHYIATNGLIHRDIAARNVIVGNSIEAGREICKVSDFGLLREMPKESTIYVSQQAGPLPLRWMAPESLAHKKFSTASDVWSYGVLLWEMSYPGQIPHASVIDNFSLVVQLTQGGLQLDIPRHYPPTVQRIMRSCWNKDPSKRPSFLLICLSLSDVIDNE